MRFQPGQSGNPAGRPRGSRNRRTIALERLSEDVDGTLTQIAIDLAMQGHPVALRLCIDRILPVKNRPITFDLPPMTNARDAATAIGSIVLGIADGDLTPDEAAVLAKRVQSFSKTLNVAELERELRELAGR